MPKIDLFFFFEFLLTFLVSFFCFVSTQCFLFQGQFLIFSFIFNGTSSFSLFVCPTKKRYYETRNRICFLLFYQLFFFMIVSEMKRLLQFFWLAVSFSFLFLNLLLSQPRYQILEGHLLNIYWLERTETNKQRRKTSKNRFREKNKT